MSGFENDVMVAKNLNFDDESPPPHLAIITAGGMLPIGTGNLSPIPEILGGFITSSTLTVGYSSPNITINTMGGGVPIEQVTVDGGQVITPSGTPENITLTGNTVANAAHAKSVFINKNGASSASVDVQVGAAIAATDITRTGLAAFNSTQFTVDANGFVSTSGTGVGNTITGDSGGALSPTAGNWNILGRSGSKTAGAVSTLTVRSPPYIDQGGSTSVTLNSGSFATAAITLTTPVTAGLADGDSLEFVATNGVLVIQLAATQVAHIGNQATTVAGTLTSTLTGDALILRYQASTNDWWATSVIGNWGVA